MVPVFSLLSRQVVALLDKVKSLARCWDRQRSLSRRVVDGLHFVGWLRARLAACFLEAEDLPTLIGG